MGAAAAAALILPAAPAAAALSTGNPALAYVEARAAAMSGDHVRAAELLAALANSRRDQVQFAQQALTEAIGSGRMDIALRVIPSVPGAKLSTDARLLMVTESIRQRRLDRAVQWLGGSGPGGLDFLAPLLRAWDAAERGDRAKALAAIAEIPDKGLLAPVKDEQAALILLKLRMPAEAEPFARRAIGAAGGRDGRVRLMLADGFLAAGDRTRATAMIDGMGGEAPAARQRIAAGRPSGEGSGSALEALSVVLTALSGEILRARRGIVPIGLVQVARYADPNNDNATGLLAVLLDSQGRTREALDLLASVPRDDALISEIRDVQVRILASRKRYDEALAIATAALKASPGMSDYARYGDVLDAMDRHGEAAQAYSRAMAVGSAQGLKSELWTLQLLHAGALEAADRWPEAKAVLEQALLTNPDQPLLLNFLGYAKLERGEDVTAAEAMIRKAIEMAPDNASIIDSLGWAQFKQGKVDEAIVTLQSAAEKDPNQAEIHEHLGDALYKSGRRIEARFAWNAALNTAEDELAARVKAKLESGLTSANAAP